MQRAEIYNFAKEYAIKDHAHFDTFVVIFISVSGRCSEISCADGRNANLSKLLFVKRVKGTSSRSSDECSILESGSFAEKDAVRLSCISTSEKDNCPEEADFLLICVTSTYPADQPNREPGSLFIQVRDQSSSSLFIAGGGGEVRGTGGFLGRIIVFRGKRWESVVANGT